MTIKKGTKEYRKIIFNFLETLFHIDTDKVSEIETLHNFIKNEKEVPKRFENFSANMMSLWKEYKEEHKNEGSRSDGIAEQSSEQPSEQPMPNHPESVTKKDESIEKKDVQKKNLIEKPIEDRSENNIPLNDLNTDEEKENTPNSSRPVEAPEKNQGTKEKENMPNSAQPVEVPEKNQSKEESSFLFPNGTVGKSYSCSVVFEKITGKKVIYHPSFEGLERLGLSFDSETKMIQGSPFPQGEHEFALLYHLEEDVNNRPLLKKKMRIIVNPDPRSLWKNIAPDQNDVYWKSDTDARIVIKQKNIIAASKRGRSHAHEGSFRDDHFEIEYLDDSQWYVMAVADGAGSAKFSRKGSEIACNTSIQSIKELISLHLAENFEKNLSEYQLAPNPKLTKMLGDTLYNTVGASCFASYKAIETEAKKNSASTRDYATTFIFTLCKKFDFGWFITAYWVGDGGVGIYQKGKDVTILGEPDSGEYAGQTKFLTMPDIWEAKALYNRLRFKIVDDFTALMAMSDGITDPLIQTDSNLKKIEKWDELWADLDSKVNFEKMNKEAHTQLLGWLDFWSQGNHDDRTLAIIY